MHWVTLSSKLRAGWVGLIACLALAWPLGAQEGRAMLEIQAADTAAARQSFTFDKDSALNFAAAEIPGFLWAPVEGVETAVDAAEVFTRLDRRFIGYIPTDRDQFEITMLTGQIKPERIAVASDMARLMLTGWVPELIAAKDHNSPDFGEALGAWRADGHDKLVRVTAWRRNDAYLIVKAEVDRDKADTYFALLAPFLGSVQFEDNGPDTLTGSFVPHQFEISEGFDLSLMLPANWQTIKSAKRSLPDGDYMGHYFYNADDPNGNAALMIFGLTMANSPEPGPDPANLKAQQGMVEMTVAMSDALMEDLLPDLAYRRVPLATVVFPDELRIGDLHAVQYDKLAIENLSADFATSALFAVQLQLKIAVGATTLAPMPSSMKAFADVNHVSYVFRILTDQFRTQFPASPDAN